MTVPDWRTSSKGAKVRAALWLHTEVKEGGTFTTQQLRDAFPTVQQIDRRARDLRDDDWVITTYREDRSLAVEERRLVKEGAPVWEPNYRPAQRSSVTDKQRQAVFAADNYLCVCCGISGGEAYPDNSLRTAKLTLARITPAGGGDPQLATCCDRCYSGQPELGSASQLLNRADALLPEQRSRLVAWVARGARNSIPELDLWAEYRRMPAASRQEVAAALAGSVAPPG